MIAKEVGYANPSSAHHAYERALLRVIHDDVNAIRKLEQDRLDIATAAIWAEVLQGNVQAVMALVRLMERRAKLLGLDMPTRTQIEVNVYERDTFDAEVARLVSLLGSEPSRALDAPTSAPRTGTN
jgi:hypothetical protein